MPMKKTKKLAKELTAAGLGLGVGASIVSRAGGHGVGPAFTTAAGFVPMITTAKMGKIVMDVYKPKKRKRKRRMY